MRQKYTKYVWDVMNNYVMDYTRHDLYVINKRIYYSRHDLYGMVTIQDGEWLYGVMNDYMGRWVYKINKEKGCFYYYYCYYYYYYCCCCFYYRETICYGLTDAFRNPFIFLEGFSIHFFIIFWSGARTLILTLLLWVFELKTFKKLSYLSVIVHS